MNKLVLFFILCGGLLLSGCRDLEDYRRERAEYAVKHFAQAKLKDLENGKHYNLVECIELALEHNLDRKVFLLEEVVARESKTAEMLGMLPDLNFNSNTIKRDSPAASASQKFKEGGATYGYSMSADEGMTTVTADLMLSVLDFGLAYFNTLQAKDRILAREMRTRRAAENLIFDVVRAYFRVAATQRSIEITRTLLEQCRDRYNLIEAMQKEQTISPFRAYDEIKRFVEMEKRLNSFVRSYENACVELRALLGFYPNSNILVDDMMLDRLPQWEFPDIEQLEEIALLERAELYEADINHNLTVLERKKALLQMFPNVRLFTDFNATTNQFAYYQSWWEVGVRSAYNLLKVPQQFSRRKSLGLQLEVQAAQAYAQAVAVMAQVRVAHANILEAKDRHAITERLYKVYNDNLNSALQASAISSELSRLELDHLRLTTVEAQLDNLLSISNIYISYYRVLNVCGVRNLGKTQLDDLQQELAAAKIRVAEAEAQAASKAAEIAAAKNAANEKTYLAKILTDKLVPRAEAKTQALTPPTTTTPAEKKLDGQRINFNGTVNALAQRGLNYTEWVPMEMLYVEMPPSPVILTTNAPSIAQINEIAKELAPSLKPQRRGLSYTAIAPQLIAEPSSDDLERNLLTAKPRAPTYMEYLENPDDATNDFADFDDDDAELTANAKK